jgi:hypothetical protein
VQIQVSSRLTTFPFTDQRTYGHLTHSAWLFCAFTTHSMAVGYASTTSLSPKVRSAYSCLSEPSDSYILFSLVDIDGDLETTRITE